MGYGEKDAVAQKRESRKKDRIVRHVDPSRAVKAKRARLEKNLSAWLRHHGQYAFSSPWSADHVRVLAKVERAVNQGGLFALAMPRGHGKTTILKWVTLYVLLTGRRKYVVLVAATAEMAQTIIEFCRQQITESDSLHEHYPHVTTYARATDGKAIKARYQLRADGKTSGIQWSKNTLVLPEVVSPTDGKPYKSNGAILEGHGLTGAIRGKWRDTKTGKVLRPDFVILDDPQTRESGESVSQCDMRERIITGDVLGLAGPKQKIAAVMPCTIIRKGDLADRFLDHGQHPEWQGETCKLVNVWPKEQDGLWKEYTEIYRQETGEGRGFDKATEFYRANREAMDAGADVAWEYRVRDGEISGLQTAENLLIETGPQFWAEYQNDPQVVSGGQYEVTPQMVMAHATDLPRLQLPVASTVFVGHCDINRSGLHWCLTAFDQQMTAHVVCYGRYPGRGELWPKNAPEQVEQTAIFRGLTELFALIGSTSFRRGPDPARLAMVLIDASYQSGTVHRFAMGSRYPFRILPAIGRAAHRYRWNKATLIGRPYDGAHVQRTEARHEPYVMFNADLWRETMQRAFLGVAGEPGGCTLYKPDNPRDHQTLAEHLTAETLCNKYQTDGGMRWEWTRQPGSAWDWGDALTGCWVAAALAGLSASGVITKPRQYIETRKPKVALE